MRVKSLMALGKLCLILACTNSSAQSFLGPTNNSWAPNDSIISIAYNMVRYFESRLNKPDAAMHTQAVYHALNNMENGQVAEWRNERSNSWGQAKIVYTWPGNGNVCRRVYSLVQTEQYVKNFEDTACYNNNTNSWRFVDKY